MNTDRNLSDKDRWLAAEYALGVLGAAEMGEAAMRVESDRAFRHAVEGWQNQLAPLLEEVDEKDPSARVWTLVQQEIYPAQAGGNSDVRFWKLLSAFTSTLAVASFAALVYFGGELTQAPDPTKPLVATLTKEGADPAYIAQFDPLKRTLLIRTALSDDTDKVPELWLIPEGGSAISLGIVSESGPDELDISNENLELLEEGGTLAITMEPPGGAPGGVATGPVIALGKLKSF